MANLSSGERSRVIMALFFVVVLLFFFFFFFFFFAFTLFEILELEASYQIDMKLFFAKLCMLPSCTIAGILVIELSNDLYLSPEQGKRNDEKGKRNKEIAEGTKE